jgi:putative tricarboxylic transport membrane protein
MRRRNFISSIVLLAITFAIFLEISRMPIGTSGRPQEGFFPFILAILLTILSVILLWQAMKEKNGKKSIVEVRSGGLKRVGLAVGALFAFAILLDFLGYIVSTFLLIAFLLRTIEPQKWWIVIVVAFLCSLVSFLVFGLLLEAQLPSGILGI